MHKKSLLTGLIAAGLSVASLNAQSLFVGPGDGTSQTVSVYTSDPLGLAGSFNASPAAFGVFANLAGAAPQKYYVVSHSGSNTLVVVDASFNSVKAPINLGQNGTNAIMTPDHLKLLITASSLQVVDTVSDNVTQNISVGGTAVDVDVSLDSKRAYVLVATGSSGAQVQAVDLTNNTVTGQPLVLSGGNVTAIAVGPNGLVYVSRQNAVDEIDGSTMTLRGTIQLNATPGKLVFLPNGKYALATNQTVVTGSSVLLMDITNRSLVSTIPNFNVVLDKLIVVNNNRVIGLSTATGATYDISITNPSFNINATFFGSVGSLNGIRNIIGSDELTNSSNTGGARFLYLTDKSSVYRIDLGSNLLSGQAVATTLPGALSFTGPALTGTPTDALTYNTTQNILPGGTSLALVVRAIDSLGRRVYAAPVTFSTATAGVIIQNPSAISNAEGWATTTITVPSTLSTGQFTVNAAVGIGGVTKTFTFNVGGGSGGTGTTPGGSGLALYQGNGQVVAEQHDLVSFGYLPLVVIVRDANLSPVGGIPVTFTVPAGAGAISAGPNGTLVTSNSSQIVVNTDSSGLASIDFIAGAVSFASSYSQTTITAATATQSVNFVVTTLIYFNLSGGSSTFVPPQTVLVTPESGTITAKVGQTITGAIQERVFVGAGTQAGQPLANAGIRVSSQNTDPKTGPVVSCANFQGDVVLTDASGLASCDLVIRGKPGNTTIILNTGGFVQYPSGGIPLVVTAGDPAAIKIIQGNNQSGTVGKQLPLALLGEVDDGAGNALGGVPVTWQVASGTATLSNVVNTTDVNGRASALVTLGNSAGTVIVKMTAGAATNSFTLTVNVIVSQLNKNGGDGQSTFTGTPFAQPVAVQVLDNNNNPVPGAAVAFTATGGATLGTPAATTDAQGIARTTVTAGSAAGTVVVTANVTGTNGGLSQTFTLTVRLPGPVFTAAGVVNFASNQPGVVPLGMATIYAQGVATGINGLVSGNPSLIGPLATTVANVQVLFNNIQAPIFWVANIGGIESITVQVPGELTPGTATLTINVNGGTSTVTGIPVKAVQPGIFTYTDSQKRTYATVIRPDGTIVTPENAARRGEQLTVVITGAGQVTPSTATNRLGVVGQSIVAPVVIGVSNSGVPVTSTQYAPDLIGMYLVTFQYPSDGPTGQNIKLSIAVGDPAQFGQDTFIAAVQ